MCCGGEFVSRFPNEMMDLLFYRQLTGFSEKAPDTPVEIHSHSHLWCQTLQSDQKNEVK